jgi:hypothetical protein
MAIKQGRSALSRAKEPVKSFWALPWRSMDRRTDYRCAHGRSVIQPWECDGAIGLPGVVIANGRKHSFFTSSIAPLGYGLMFLINWGFYCSVLQDFSLKRRFGSMGFALRITEGSLSGLISSAQNQDTLSRLPETQHFVIPSEARNLSSI